MEKIKLWQIDGDDATPLDDSNRMESEEVLENILVRNPGLLIKGLTIVGRQTPTDGGPLDLLGVDGDGKLCVFELKRGTVAREAVAQIIDYASDLDHMELGELATHISDRSRDAQGIDIIENFQDWYGEQFQELESLDQLKPLRLFLVGLSVDDRTERMVRFLADNSGMDISLLTFHGFNHEGKMVLAKQVKIEADAETSDHPARQWPSTAERKERLAERLDQFGYSETFDAVREMFRENWPSRSEYVGQTAIGMYLTDPTESGKVRSYARIGTDPETLQIVFYARTINLCTGKFDSIKEEIHYYTYRGPSDPESIYESLTFPLAGLCTFRRHRQWRRQGVGGIWRGF